MLTTYIYDGSFEGFLSAVFTYFERRPKQVQIVQEKRYQPDAFAGVLTVTSDENQAERVWRGLKKKMSSQGLSTIYSCYLSELPCFEHILLNCIIRIFEDKRRVEADFSCTFMLQLSQIARKVGREKHRFEAFVRFEKQANGLFYAGIEPDFNVLPLIAPHFTRRYADQPWLIFDIRRSYGIHYDLQSVQEVHIAESKNRGNSSAKISYDDKEAQYQLLWQDYFRHVNIPQRKNMKLHRQHVPLRYVKNMAEIVNI